MALAVITVASGGLPVTDVTATAPLRGMAVTEAIAVGANKWGRAVTKVPNGLPVTFVAAEGAGGGSAQQTVLDPATTFETTVSGAGLIATRTSFASDVYGGAHSIDYKSTGKYYFEVTIGFRQGSQNATGILRLGATYQNLGQGNTLSTAARSSDGLIYSNDVSTGKTVGQYVTGDILGLAFDLTARLAWIRRNGGNWNGTAGADPATGTGGVTIGTGSFAPATGLTSMGDMVTVNFSGSAFSGAVPAGFTSGWPA